MRSGRGRRGAPGRECGAAGDRCNDARIDEARSRRAAIDDQDAVEEFAAEAADEAFGDRVGPRCPDRRSDDPDVDGGKHRVEGGGEPGVAVPDEESEAPTGVVKVHAGARACWVSQALVGWAVTPRMFTRRVACSITKKTYSRRRVMMSK
jgi:hypothetical protein